MDEELTKKLVEAKTAHANAEAEKASAEAETFRLDNEKLLLEIAKKKRAEEEELASDKYNYLYSFDSAIGDSTVEACIKQLAEWDRLHPNCDIEIVFLGNPGGSIIPGLALFDYIRFLRSRGHHITTSTLGMAASMAGILLQAGNTRIMAKESWLLIHEASFMAMGKVGEIEDTTDWVKRIMKRILKIFAERSKLSVGQITRKWRRKDWWIDSDEAKNLGLVDEIR